jgi:hypothetical protein
MYYNMKADIPEGNLIMAKGPSGRDEVKSGEIPFVVSLRACAHQKGRAGKRGRDGPKGGGGGKEEKFIKTCLGTLTASASDRAATWKTSHRAVQKHNKSDSQFSAQMPCD